MVSNMKVGLFDKVNEMKNKIEVDNFNKAKWLRKAVFSNVIEKDQNYFEITEKENNERKKLKTMTMHMNV